MPLRCLHDVSRLQQRGSKDNFRIAADMGSEFGRPMSLPYSKLEVMEHIGCFDKCVRPKNVIFIIVTVGTAVATTVFTVVTVETAWLRVPT